MAIYNNQRSYIVMFIRVLLYIVIYSYSIILCMLVYFNHLDELRRFLYRQSKITDKCNCNMQRSCYTRFPHSLFRHAHFSKSSIYLALYIASKGNWQNPQIASQYRQRSHACTNSYQHFCCMPASRAWACNTLGLGCWYTDYIEMVRIIIVEPEFVRGKISIWHDQFGNKYMFGVMI